MEKFIDIHTHQQYFEADIFSIKNIISNQAFSIEQNQYYSAGLHPWYLDEANKNIDYQQLIKFASQKSIIAIGEIGLDRIIKTDFNLQIKLLVRQILLAEKLNKPIIIHCVKAYYDIISIKKNINPKVPFIVHGFEQNHQIFSQLLNHGFYFSFGSAIFNLNSNAFSTIQKTPLDKLFLETDNTKISIKEIYQQAAVALQIPVIQLIEQVSSNFIKIFGDDIFSQ